LGTGRAGLQARVQTALLSRVGFQPTADCRRPAEQADEKVAGVFAKVAPLHSELRYIDVMRGNDEQQGNVFSYINPEDRIPMTIRCAGFGS